MEQASCHESDSDKSRSYWDYPSVLRTKFDKDGQIGTGLIGLEPLALPEGRRYRSLDYVWPASQPRPTPLHYSSGGFYEGGEAKGSDVGLPEEPEAVRPGWPMGRVAQAEQEAGGVVHRHYDGTE